MTAGAFKAYQYIMFMAIESGAKTLEGYMSRTIGEINKNAAIVLSALDKSEKRNALAKRVLSDTYWLKYSSPETKGMLLYQLTRHGTVDNFHDVGISGWFQDRKAAVLVILGWIQTLNEWHSVMHRISLKGEKNGGSSKGLLIAFLQQGWNRHEELNDMEQKLRKKPLRGRAIHPNTSTAYTMHTSDSPEFRTHIV